MAKSPLLKPREAAERLRMKPENVRTLIRSGAIAAIDVAMPGSKRPRFLISPEALEAFELSRRVHPPVKTARKKRTKNPPDFVEYF